VTHDPRQNALLYLQQHQVMTIATNGPEGLWAAAVFYANEAFTLYFLSASHTRHAQNMLANPHVAATIQEDYQDWKGIQGIQLSGSIRRLQGAERALSIALYQAKYPFIAGADPHIQRALSGVDWYQLTPERFYFIDNRQGLGHRDEIKM
jgi:uncharacterized protein YhbP (UPF0306 family)